MNTNQFEIELFAQSSRYPMWAAAILSKLSEECWTAPRSVSSFAVIEASFNEQAEESMDDKRCILSDPDCAEYARMSKFPDEHPWGDDVVKICRKWLAEKSGPAAVWEFVDRLYKTASELLVDELPTLTLGEGGNSFARSIERAFEDAIGQVRKSLLD